MDTEIWIYINLYTRVPVYVPEPLTENVLTNASKSEQ